MTFNTELIRGTWAAVAGQLLWLESGDDELIQGGRKNIEGSPLINEGQKNNRDKTPIHQLHIDGMAEAYGVRKFVTLMGEGPEKIQLPTAEPAVG